MLGELMVIVAALGGAPAGQHDTPIEAVRASTVLIEVFGPRGPSSGSGFVVAQDGTIATAAHVIQNAWKVTIRLGNGTELPVLGIRHIDRDLDLALLAVPPTGLRPVALGNSDSVRVGQRLLAMGCPFGLSVSVADGLLSAVHAGDGHRLLQVSIPVSPGSSGGPVFTEDGSVVGIVVSGMRGRGAENINFALPFNYVRSRLSQALAREPAPLASLASSEMAGLFSAETGLARTPLDPVNTAVAADFSAVDGLELLTRWKRADGAEFTSLLRVGLARSAEGSLVVERLRETSVSLDSEVGREVHRTVYRVGGENLFSTTVQFTPVDGRAEAYGSALEVRGEDYMVRDMRGFQHTGRAPAGVLPQALADIVLAAQGSALTVVEFLTLDPVRERLVPARYEFTGRAKRKIPVARDGGSCALKPKVVDTEVEVLIGTREIGLERSRVAVLAAQPHLVLEDNLRCVRLPKPH